MPDFSLVPVDHQPDFGDVSLVPVDHGVGTPANGDGIGGPPNGAAGGVLNPTLDQGESEAAPFSGYANPSPTESLVNREKMKDQADLVEADPTGNSGATTDGGELYNFVTTGPTRRYPIDGATGTMIIATSPFYAFDGTRYAIIDASPEHPLTVRVPEDGKFTISRP